MLNLTDTGTALTGAATVICPTLSKVYIVRNDTGQTVTVKTSSGTGVAVTDGNTAFVHCDGTNVVESLSYVAGNFGVGGNLTTTGNATVSVILPLLAMLRSTAIRHLVTRQQIL